MNYKFSLDTSFLMIFHCGIYCLKLIAFLRFGSGSASPAKTLQILFSCLLWSSRGLQSQSGWADWPLGGASRAIFRRKHDDGKGAASVPCFDETFVFLFSCSFVGLSCILFPFRAKWLNVKPICMCVCVCLEGGWGYVHVELAFRSLCMCVCVNVFM